MSTILSDLHQRRAARGAATYTAQDVANLLAINTNAIYREARAGRIPCIRVGKRFVFPRAAIDRWIASAGGQSTPAA